ncbi:MAG: endonuclease [Phycisphaeraceae bacterium]|nr:endonuclease [Phycisphaeraceae bacterium]
MIGCDPPGSSFAEEGGGDEVVAVGAGDYFGIGGDTAGDALKAGLHELVDGHERLNYRELWHAQDPPDDWERGRNDRVEAVQGNRNPFIDRPEFAERVWGV